MKLHVAMLPTLIAGSATDDCIAVVIDTLRFTTTACQALSAGAASIHVSADIDDAMQQKAEHHGLSRLCGERHCRPIAGFDMGNSPAEYTSEAVRAVSLFFTTSNGTRAVFAARQAQSIWLSALVNRAATSQQLCQSNCDKAWLVCAGTEGQISLEDTLTAGAILDLALRMSSTVQATGDPAHIALQAWRSLCVNGIQDPSPRVIREQMAIAKGGKNLLDAGYESDLLFAAQLDQLECVPQSHPQSTRLFL